MATSLPLYATSNVISKVEHYAPPEGCRLTAFQAVNTLVYLQQTDRPAPSVRLRFIKLSTAVATQPFARRAQKKP